MDRRSYLAGVSASVALLSGCSEIGFLPASSEIPTKTTEETNEAESFAVRLRNRDDSPHTVEIDVSTSSTDAPPDAPVSLFRGTYTIGPTSSVEIPNAVEASRDLRVGAVLNPQFESDLRYPKQEPQRVSAGGWPSDSKIVVEISEPGTLRIRVESERWRVETHTDRVSNLR